MPDRSVILLAEDREDDILLIRDSFLEAGVTNPLFIVRTGSEAISYLAGEDKFSNRCEFPLPDLLLLDLKLPGADGFEVLRWIKSQPSLSALRVLVLTSSQDWREIDKAYKLGASSFLVKPFDFQNFIDLSKSIKSFWLETSKAPNISRPKHHNGNNRHT